MLVPGDCKRFLGVELCCFCGFVGFEAPCSLAVLGFWEQGFFGRKPVRFKAKGLGV